MCECVLIFSFVVLTYAKLCINNERSDFKIFTFKKERRESFFHIEMQEYIPSKIVPLELILKNRSVFLSDFPLILFWGVGF